jgi:hypothetical protein
MLLADMAQEHLQAPVEDQAPSLASEEDDDSRE